MKSIFPAPTVDFSVYSNRERTKRNLYAIVKEDADKRGYLIYDTNDEEDYACERLHAILLAWQIEKETVTGMRIEMPQMPFVNLSNIRRIVSVLRALGVADELFKRVVKPTYGTWTNFVYQVSGVQFEFIYTHDNGWVLQGPLMSCTPDNLMR